eukprot:2628430-Pleurochrysis_carterae.AAC.1
MIHAYLVEAEGCMHTRSRRLRQFSAGTSGPYSRTSVGGISSFPVNRAVYLMRGTSDAATREITGDRLRPQQPRAHRVPGVYQPSASDSATSTPLRFHDSTPPSPLWFDFYIRTSFLFCALALHELSTSRSPNPCALTSTSLAIF